MAVAGAALGWYFLIMVSLVLSVAAFALGVENRRHQLERSRREAEEAVKVTALHGGPMTVVDG